MSRGGEGSRFVAVPAAAFERIAERVAEGLTKLAVPDGHQAGEILWGKVGRELTLTILLPGPEAGRPAVCVYTSLAAGATEVRDVGDDAVRVVVGTYGLAPFRGNGDGTWSHLAPINDPKKLVFRPLADGRRVFRTAPTRLAHEARVAAFSERLLGVLREAYAAARAVPRCPKCARPMRERCSARGPFLGCSGFPECRGTTPLAARSA